MGHRRGVEGAGVEGAEFQQTWSGRRGSSGVGLGVEQVVQVARAVGFTGVVFAAAGLHQLQALQFGRRRYESHYAALLDHSADPPVVVVLLRGQAVKSVKGVLVEVVLV